MTVKFTNNASTTVGTGINASATSLTVASASSFPSLSGADDYCYLTIQGATSTTREVVKATALSGNTFTIVRAQDNTSAGTWTAGDIVELRMTAALLTDVIDAATVEGVKTNFQYTPTAGQTVFSGSDNASNTLIINQAALVSVYMNGVRLVQGTDYSVSSANNTVTLTVGATTADIIDIEVFGNFTGQSGAAVAITGGAISGTSVAATTLSASGTATLNTFVSSNSTISGGTINNVNIGATTAGTGRFSSVTTTGSVGINNANPTSYFNNANDLVVGGATGSNGITISGDGDTQIFFADGTSGDTAYRGVIRYVHTGGIDQFEFKTAGANNALILDSSQNATFSGAVTTGNTITVNSGHLNLASDGAHIYLGADIDMRLTHSGSAGTFRCDTGDMTFDVAGDIILDADSGAWRLKDNGSSILDISVGAGSSPTFYSPFSDAAIVFRGSDGGTPITALTLDMANGGNVQARRARSNTAGGVALSVQPSDSTIHYGFRIDSSTNSFNLDRVDSAANLLTVDVSGNATFTGSVTGTSLVASNGILELDDNGTHNGVINVPASLRINIDSDNNSTGESFQVGVNASNISSGNILFKIDESGNVGIGEHNPVAKLALKGANDTNFEIQPDLSNGVNRITNFNRVTSVYKKLRVDASQHEFYISGNPKVTIDASGNVGIGTPGPEYLLTLEDTTPTITLNHDTSWPAANAELGRIYFGTDWNGVGAKIKGESDGQWGNSDYPGRLTFWTTPDGAADALERMRIRSGGEVDITQNSNAVGTFADNIGEVGSGNFCLQVHNSAGDALKPFGIRAEDIRFATGSATRMTVNSNGNVNIGMPSGYNAEGKLHVYNGASGKSYAADAADLLIVENSGSAAIDIRTPNGNTGGILFSDSDGRGRGVIQYAHGGGDIMYFNTASAERMNLSHNGLVMSVNLKCADVIASGSGGLSLQTDEGTKRILLHDSGHVGINSTATPSSTVRGFMFTTDQLYTSAGNVTSNNTQVRFINGNGLVGSISTSGSVTGYATSSDQRLKENIEDANDAGALIDAIQVRQFDWKADGEHQRYGMVAQELELVVPEAVTQVFEEPDEMMGVDYSKLVPMLIKEIQTLRSRVAELETN